MHRDMEKQYTPDKWPAVLNKLKKDRCLIGISGGFDSALLLDYAIEWGLNPLVIHFDNWHNSGIANRNIERLVQKTGVDFIRYHVDKNQYDKLNKSFLMYGLPDADIPNDMVMTALMYKAARQHGIKYILNGHNFRTEGSTPVNWTYMDAKYIKSVYRAATGQNLTLPVFTFPEQIVYSLLGIKQVRPFYYHDFDFEKEKARLIAKYDLEDYGAKHGENHYTNFVGSWYLPEIHNIDKRRVYLSAQIRNGDISREDAITKLVDQYLPKEVIDLIGKFQPAFNFPRSKFDRYNFRRYRPLIWMMVKIGALPVTFYKKYCK